MPVFTDSATTLRRGGAEESALYRVGSFELAARGGREGPLLWSPQEDSASA